MMISGNTCSQCARWQGNVCSLFYNMKAYQWCTMFQDRNSQFIYSGNTKKEQTYDDHCGTMRD